MAATDDTPGYGSEYGAGYGSAYGPGRGSPYAPGYASEYVPGFRPTHVVPRDGLPAWEAPDPELPTASLDAFLPVQLTERVGDWGQVLCSNGWSAWVDARLLVSVPADPPAAGGPPARTADPRPLIARAEDALGRYRRAAEELAAGRADGETFRQRTRGLRIGMVVDGESVWLYDAEHERWVYCDGEGLHTYAASSGPSAAARTPAGVAHASAAATGDVAGAPGASGAAGGGAGAGGVSASPAFPEAGPSQPPPAEGAPSSPVEPAPGTGPEAEPEPVVAIGHEPTQVVPQLVQDAGRGPGRSPGPGNGTEEGPGATRVVSEPPPMPERSGARADAEPEARDRGPEPRESKPAGPEADPDGPGESR
ncbi:hypothetical protein [Streptomyces roseicoloratus]|uniref:hypothetical protein n=1 Tax=Streptomyces roseicoloratus TaxID=2508722 RepID=UPI003CCC7BD9